MRPAAHDDVQMRLSPRRVLAWLMLVLWGGLFWFLMATGRTALYLSSRTDWVVPIGAVILTGAVLGRAFSLREPTPSRVTAREAGIMAFIAMPVVIALALPPASLGSFAASRRSSVVGGSFVASADNLREGELRLADVGGALRSPEAMEALAGRAGSDVSFVGFVVRDPGDPADEFTLTRFMISCCVADALSVEVRVVGAPPGVLEEDRWVRVEGKLYPLGTEVVVDATDVTEVERPKRPYLNP